MEAYGVCRLSIVPVRKEPTHVSEQVTQLLFGEHYEVTERQNDWVLIRNPFDDYTGWIHIRQHHEISGDYFLYQNKAEFKITTDLTATILYNKHPLTIVMGSVIPITSSELFKMEEQFAFNGEAKNLGQKRDAEFLRRIAMKYLDAPYLWGGKTPFGLDCSGFVQMTFKISGYRLKRDAYQQAIQGTTVNTLNDALPGDLVFFKSESTGRVDHVGILLAGDRIIHCSGRVRVDRITHEGIVDEKQLVTHFVSGIRRVLA